MSSTTCNAWLERAGGADVQIAGVCNLGRSSSNQVVLTDRKASRRHALIQPQGSGEFWLVDFGSTNGTSVNGLRVAQPTLLKDGDQISIGDENLTFRQELPPAPGLGAARKPGAKADEGTGTITLEEIKRMNCWLLLVDIIGSTRLGNTCPPDELPIVLGRWFSDCRETIEACQGQINKFLGDGFFAYWDESPAAIDNVKQAMEMLRQAQSLSQPPFRWILHFGQVSVGGALSMGEASVWGRDVNFAFRMEKIAGQHGAQRMLSMPAYEKLALTQPCGELGPVEVSGFTGTFMFRTL
jgi:class 3 adenylate cyclase